jgi:hypothetical protein
LIQQYEGQFNEKKTTNDILQKLLKYYNYYKKQEGYIKDEFSIIYDNLKLFLKENTESDKNKISYITGAIDELQLFIDTKKKDDSIKFNTNLNYLEEIEKELEDFKKSFNDKIYKSEDHRIEYLKYIKKELTEYQNNHEKFGIQLCINLIGGINNLIDIIITKPWDVNQKETTIEELKSKEGIERTEKYINSSIDLLNQYIKINSDKEKLNPELDKIKKIIEQFNKILNYIKK